MRRRRRAQAGVSVMEEKIEQENTDEKRQRKYLEEPSIMAKLCYLAWVAIVGSLIRWALLLLFVYVSGSQLALSSPRIVSEIDSWPAVPPVVKPGYFYINITQTMDVVNLTDFNLEIYLGDGDLVISNTPFVLMVTLLRVIDEFFESTAFSAENVTEWCHTTLPMEFAEFMGTSNVSEANIQELLQGQLEIPINKKLLNILGPVTKSFEGGINNSDDFEWDSASAEAVKAGFSGQHNIAKSLVDSQVHTSHAKASSSRLDPNSEKFRQQWWKWSSRERTAWMKWNALPRYEATRTFGFCTVDGGHPETHEDDILYCSPSWVTKCYKNILEYFLKGEDSRNMTMLKKHELEFHIDDQELPVVLTVPGGVSQHKLNIAGYYLQTSSASMWKRTCLNGSTEYVYMDIIFRKANMMASRLFPKIPFPLSDIDKTVTILVSCRSIAWHF